MGFLALIFSCILTGISLRKELGINKATVHKSVCTICATVDHVNFVLTRDIRECVSQGALVEQICTIHGGGTEIYTIHGGGTEIYTIHGGGTEISTIHGGGMEICTIHGGVTEIYTIHGGEPEIYTIQGGGTMISTIHGGGPEIYTIHGGVTGICIIRMPSAMPMGSIRSSLILSFENLHGAALLLRGISAPILKVSIYSPPCSCKQGICAVALRVSIRLCTRGNGRVAFRYEVYPRISVPSVQTYSCFPNCCALGVLRTNPRQLERVELLSV